MSRALSELEETMLGHELTLLHTDHRKAPERLQQMLTAEFCEITPIGTTSSRQQVIEWLMQKDPSARWELSALCLRQATDDLGIVSYHARQIIPEKPHSLGALHLSVWRREPESGRWQLSFHQSTKVQG